MRLLKQVRPAVMAGVAWHSSMRARRSLFEHAFPPTEAESSSRVWCFRRMLSFDTLGSKDPFRFVLPPPAAPSNAAATGRSEGSCRAKAAGGAFCVLSAVGSTFCPQGHHYGVPRRARSGRLSPTLSQSRSVCTLPTRHRPLSACPLDGSLAVSRGVGSVLQYACSFGL